MTALAISGLGAITSVGRDAASSCAAIRAGIVRPRALDGPAVLDVLSYSEVPVTGHPVGSIARGFANVGRWLQLLPVAIRDLCGSGSLPSPAENGAFWKRTACWVIVPEFTERFIPDMHSAEESLQSTLGAPLARRVDSCFAPRELRVVASGRAGVLDAVSAAAAPIEEGSLDRAVIVAVDSLVDVPALEWLMSTRRLNSDSNPTGLIPGEACCAFLVEAPRAAAARGASSMLRWASSKTVGGRPGLAGEGSVQGDALARAVEGVLSEVRPGGFEGPAITDLNGEEWRAREFGMAQVRVPRSLWRSGAVWAPLASTGDVGAAATALQVLVACRALLRGYAGEQCALLTVGNESGLAGAAMISNEA